MYMYVSFYECIAVSYSQDNKNGGWHCISLHDPTSVQTPYKVVANIRHLFPVYSMDFSLDGRYIQSHYKDIKDTSLRAVSEERFIPDVSYHSSRTGSVLKKEVYPPPSDCSWDSWTLTQGYHVKTLSNPIIDGK